MYNTMNTIIFTCGNEMNFKGNFYDVLDSYISKRKKRNHAAYTYKVNMTREQFWNNEEQEVTEHSPMCLPDNVTYLSQYVNSSKCSMEKFYRHIGETESEPCNAIILPFAR